ncbi:MAG: hypothetical protein JW981_06960 [Anaerolineae bacterium]|nr:hypothetical protein [Anaerolineae bacterium]
MSPFVLWLSRLSSFASIPAVMGIFLTGAGIYLITEWRIRLIALMGQYFLIGILFVRLFESRPEIALLKILVGWLICGALFISARIRDEAVKEKGLHLTWSSNLPFRILSLVSLMTAAYLGAQRYSLPFVPADLALACFILGVLALLFIGTEEDVVVVGVGILNLLSGLDIFYSAQDPGLVVTGLLIMVNLSVGLAISYLTVVGVTE